MENLYDVLEVSQKASQEVIEKAYKTLVKKWHPDLQESKNRPVAEEMMKKINNAYNILGDEDKRKEYDAELESIREASRQKEKQSTTQQTEKQTHTTQTREQEYTQNKSREQEYTQNNYTTEAYEQKRQVRNHPQYNSQHQEPQNIYDDVYDEEWKNEYSKLSPKAQRKLIRKLEIRANEEYRRMYENYFRSLGYEVPHKITLKDIKVIFIAILVICLVIGILWLIPISKQFLIDLYNNNIVVKIVVNIIRGIIMGIIKTIQQIFNG